MAQLSRWLEPLLESSIQASPVVILEGGRAVGKSTLCDTLIEKNGWGPRIDLADPNSIALLRLDPQEFLSSLPVPAVIDEAQLEPQLTLWVKQIVDRRRSPGHFILTGSARLGRGQLGGSDPLAGRAVRLHLWSFAQNEMRSQRSDFLDRAFGDGWKIGATSNHSQQSESDKASARWFGGMPGITGVLRGGAAAQWEREIAAYVESVLPLGAGGSRVDLGRLLLTFRYFAANSGQILNVTRAASELGSQVATVRNQLEILESCFLLFRCEAERPSEHKVVVSHPRLFASDVGLALWAARAWAGDLSATLRGSLSETLVAHDLAAAISAHTDRIVLRHWRDGRNQHEVDQLLIHPDGRLVAIEVKASTSVGPSDADGLRRFAAAEPARFVRGLVLYEGPSVLKLSAPGEPELLAVPRAFL